MSQKDTQADDYENNSPNNFSLFSKETACLLTQQETSSSNNKSNNSEVRPANQPKIGIVNWNKPKAKAVRSTWRCENTRMEMLPLSATAKQSADKLKAIKRIEGKSITRYPV